jgi:hypothetical protein
MQALFPSWDRVMVGFTKTDHYPGTGGVAAHQRIAAKQPLIAQTGWSVQNDQSGKPPRLRLLWWLRDIF